MPGALDATIVLLYELQSIEALLIIHFILQSLLRSDILDRFQHCRLHCLPFSLIVLLANEWFTKPVYNLDHLEAIGTALDLLAPLVDSNLSRVSSVAIDACLQAEGELAPTKAQIWLGHVCRPEQKEK